MLLFALVEWLWLWLWLFMVGIEILLSFYRLMLFFLCNFRTFKIICININFSNNLMEYLSNTIKTILKVCRCFFYNNVF